MSKYVVIAAKGDRKFPIAYGESKEEAELNGEHARYAITASGGSVESVEVMAVWRWDEQRDELIDKLFAAKEVLRDWAGKKGHDRCWYYPDLFHKLADLFDVKVDPEKVSRSDFKTGCKLYQIEEFGPEERTKDSVEMKLTFAYHKRKDDLPDDFEPRVARAIRYLMNFINNGLTHAEINHDVMPDYTNTKVELIDVEECVLQAVRPESSDGNGRHEADELDPGAVRDQESAGQAQG